MSGEYSIDVGSWVDQARCRLDDRDVFFDGDIAKNGVKGRNSHEAAVEICSECPVAERCLAYAIKHDCNDGIWGGLTSSERNALKRRAAAAAIRSSIGNR